MSTRITPASLTLAVATLAMSVSTVSFAQETTLIDNTFTTSGEGWMSRITNSSGVTTYVPVSWDPAAGFSGGGIFHLDEAGGHQFVGPPSYEGDQSQLVGRGRIKFDFKTDHINSGGTNVFARYYSGNKYIIKLVPITTSAENQWLHLDFFFDEAASWRYVDPDTGEDVTPATLGQICAVLSDVTELQLVGETLVGPSETVHIDNVQILSTVCGCDDTGVTPTNHDANSDGVINGADLGDLLAAWGLVFPDGP